MKLKAIIGIILCKALRLVSRILHRGGTAMPGRFALKVCPELLHIVSSGVTTVAVTGTNGKTTTARMIEETLRRAGLNVFYNGSGANLIDGITTEFVMNSDLAGKCRCDYAVIECDEAAAIKVFKEMKPKIVVVTNLFRDQTDRFGDVTVTLAKIKEAVANVPEAILCLNADCSLTASLADGATNKVAWYGMNKGALPEREKSANSDAPNCVRCGTEYVYDYVTFGHLGGFRCPKCGYRRQSPDYAVTDISSRRMDGTTVVMDIRGEKKLVDIRIPAVFNVYNAAACVAAASELGFAADDAIAALPETSCSFGRMEEFPLGRAGARMMLIKNAAGCDQVLEFLEGVKEKFSLVIVINNRVADGTDISWLADANFEALNGMSGWIENIVTSGDRAEEMAERIRQTGFDSARLTMEQDYDRLVQWADQQEIPVLIMQTYTAMLELREVIVKHCGGKSFYQF